MSDSVTLRTRKFIRNVLLQRRQMIVDVVHPNKASVSRAELQETLSKMYKSSANCVSVFGFRTAFGGGNSTGFALIYDNEAAFKKFEPKHRQVRNGLKVKVERSRKQIKESKNRGKKIRGTGASIAKHKANRAAKAD